MKRLFLFALALTLFAPLGMAQTETDPDMIAGISSTNTTRGLGDSLWSTSVEGATGDVYNLGVEYDGADYWITVGAPAGGRCYFYRIDQAGNKISRSLQPSGVWDTWGLRDLAFDGIYMYGGNDVWNASYIAQMDLTGAFTGTLYGPHLDPAMTVCRALAYDTNNDVFYSANWGSAVYECDRLNNVIELVPATTLSCYGAACEESTTSTKLWLWWYDGLSDHGSEIDVGTKAFTGLVFDGMAGATAGGACAYPTGGGDWELVALHQSSPDTIEAYTLNKTPDPLEVNTNSIDTHYGGVAQFNLDAGVGNAGDGFVLWASITPGSFPLPGGAMLPFAFDIVTNTVLNYAIAGLPLLPFIGVLDGNGQASLNMTIPPGADLPVDLPMMLAFSTHNPFDFVSNIVNVTLEGWVAPTSYIYDDGTSEVSLGTSGGGSYGWYQWYDVVPGYATISEIHTQFGSLLPGQAITVALWDDPNNDGDPTDCGAPVVSLAGFSANEDTDIFNVYDITDTVVSSRFFIGCITDMLIAPDSYPGPMDDTTAYPGGHSWFANDQTGVINLSNIADPTAAIPISENATTGWPYYWCLRAY